MTWHNGFQVRYSRLVLFFIALLLSSCGNLQTTPSSPDPTVTQPLETVTIQGEEDDSGLSSDLEVVANIVPTRTPVLTATPGPVMEGVDDLLQETGLSGRTLLGLEYADWINLIISLFYVLIAYLIGTWLIRWLLPHLVRRTPTVLDDRLLQTSGSELRWLAVAVILGFSTRRLDFISADFKTLLTDIYFLLGLGLVTLMLWRLINLAAQQARERAEKAGRKEEGESLITLSVWALRLIVIVFAISFVLTHFAIRITGFAVFLGIVGLVLSLASRDILADIISGAIILLDRPYRIGDRIYLPFIETWGNVIDIGMRSTKVLTLDNRMIIVPNSQIGKDQIVNYSYPDPSYYDTLNIGVAYDNDVEQVGQLIADTVRTVEGVQTERGIDVLLMAFSENQMLFEISWWLETYKDLNPVRNRVSRAVIQALKDAGVVLPGSLRVEMNSK
jgi:small-conductance mechanosensitive channel